MFIEKKCLECGILFNNKLSEFNNQHMSVRQFARTKFCSGNCSHKNRRVYNEYSISDNCVYMKYKDRTIIFDLSNLEKFKSIRWRVDCCGYAASGHKKDGNLITTRMHNVVLKGEKGMCVDHINGNKLDNRQTNLRLVNKSMNQFNFKSKCSRGVFFDKKNNSYIVSITKRGKTTYLGRFRDKKMAIEKRKKAELMFYGELSPNYK